MKEGQGVNVGASIARLRIWGTSLRTSDRGRAAQARERWVYGPGGRLGGGSEAWFRLL